MDKNLEVKNTWNTNQATEEGGLVPSSFFTKESSLLSGVPDSSFGVPAGRAFKAAWAAATELRRSGDSMADWC